MQRPCAQDLYKIKSKKTKALFYIPAKKKKKKIILKLLFFSLWQQRRGKEGNRVGFGRKMKENGGGSEGVVWN